MPHEITPATATEVALKTRELLRLLAAHEYRFASRLADIIADDLAELATAAGQPDEPICDGNSIPRCE